MILYSRSTNGFYLASASSHIPDDAVKISRARHAQLLAAQAEGSRIVPDARGRPRVERRSRPDAELARARLREAVRAEAARRIRAISPEWRQLNDLREPTEAGRVRFARIDAIRVAAGAIEDLAASLSPAAIDAFSIVDHPLWPEFHDA